MMEIPEAANPKRRALFLDRDGVIHREAGYLWRKEEVEFLPGIFGLCRAAQVLGYVIIVVTNQSGIGRGYYSEEEFHELMRWMQQEFDARKINLTAYYFCPHHPVHGRGKYQKDCADRKPGPGMILQAARDHNLDLEASVMIGDRCSDIASATAAGVGKIFLLRGIETSPCSGNYIAVEKLDDILPALTLPKS